MNYILENELLHVEIAAHGAEIKEIKYQGKDLLHDSNPKFWGRSAPYLFPNIGTIKDKFTIFNNQEYPLTKHGFIRDFEFTLINKSNDKLVLQFESNSDTLKLYPYEFIFTIGYQLNENELITNVVIKNLSNDLMPFNFGLHPAFRIPFDGGQFEDYQIKFSEVLTSNLPLVNLSSGLIDWNQTFKEVKNLESFKLNHEDYYQDALVFDKCPKEVSIISPKGSMIKVKTSDFTKLGIWTPYPIKAPFICIEPWIGCADSPESNHQFITKQDIIYLDKNQEWNINFSYQFIIK